MLNKGLLKILTMICFLGAMFVSCNDDDDNDVKIDYDATYEFEVRFTGKWYAEDFNTDFPDGASFASFVGLTHKKQNSLYALGTKASAGLRGYAETGNTAALESEIQEKIDANTSSAKIVGVQVGPEGNTSVTFRTTLRYKYFSLVAKINPGPDWFVAIENLELTNMPLTDNAITNLFLVNDAGVNDGSTFADHGADTPNGVVKRLTSGDLSVAGVIPNMGYVTIINKGIVTDE